MKTYSEHRDMVGACRSATSDAAFPGRALLRRPRLPSITADAPTSISLNRHWTIVKCALITITVGAALALG